MLVSTFLTRFVPDYEVVALAPGLCGKRRLVSGCAFGFQHFHHLVGGGGGGASVGGVGHRLSLYNVFRLFKGYL